MPKILGWIVSTAAQIQLWLKLQTLTECSLGKRSFWVLYSMCHSTVYAPVVSGFHVLPHLPSYKLQYLHVVRCRGKYSAYQEWKWYEWTVNKQKKASPPPPPPPLVTLQATVLSKNISVRYRKPSYCTGSSYTQCLVVHLFLKCCVARLNHQEQDKKKRKTLFKGTAQCPMKLLAGMLLTHQLFLILSK